MTDENYDGNGREADGERRHVGNPKVTRRELLTGTGISAGALAGCYSLTNGSTRPENGDDGGWESKADARIEAHRTTDLDVFVEDANGRPVSNARVEVKMQRHSFGFGTAVNAEHLVERTGQGDTYRHQINQLFNKAVLENHHKWGFWEVPRDRRRAEAATGWLLDQGLEMRGHTCIWQKRNQGAIPDDVVQAMDEGNGELIERRASEHIEEIVGHYADTPRFTEWDILNEQVTEHGMTDAINPQDPSTKAHVIPDWYRLAKRADPDGQRYINEYSILAGDDVEHKDKFETVVRHLLEHGAPLDGIGVQAHHWDASQRRTPPELLSTLDRFAELVPSIQIHEYDTWGDTWTEEMEADYFHTFLKTVYSHPAVEGFLMWGFWDELHWHQNAPLFRRDWSRKPAYDVYTGLVFDEWWTDERGRTGADGRFGTEGFLGDHELRIHADGITRSTTIRLQNPTERRRVMIRLPTPRSSSQA